MLLLVIIALHETLWAQGILIVVMGHNKDFHRSACDEIISGPNCSSNLETTGLGGSLSSSAFAAPPDLFFGVGVLAWGILLGCGGGVLAAAAAAAEAFLVLGDLDGVNLAAALESLDAMKTIQLFL